MIEKYKALYDEMQNVAQAINGEYLPTVLELMETQEITGLILARCQIAQSAEPNPVTIAAFTERDPYSNEDTIAQSLETVAEAGYLTAVEPGKYCLTKQGQSLALLILDEIDKAGSKSSPLPPEEGKKLVAFLDQIRQACLESDVPSTACLQRSLRFDRGNRSPITEQIRRRINDLAAFRDDVHIASWSGLDVKGPAWEAFGHISAEHVFGEAANTAEKLADKLNFRGFTAENYADFLQPLVERGWLALDGSHYSVTEKGQTVRDEAEQKTDHYFYHTWQIKVEEADKMLRLMKSLVAALTPPDNNEIYDLALDTRGAIGSLYAEKLQEASQEAGLPEWGMYILMHAQAQVPNSINTKSFKKLIPYMNADTMAAHLRDTAAAGYLDASGDGYFINDKGKQILTLLRQLVSNSLDQTIGVPVEELNETAVLLAKINDRIEKTADPEAKPDWQNARFYSPQNGSPPLLRISRAISELASFRDDVHVASFYKFDMPAHEWEAFSHVWGENIWGDKVNTAAEVARKLEFRGYSEADYAAGLQTAVERGWLSVNKKGVYSLTEKGKVVREDSEQETNRLFFAPWQVLSPSELIRLHNGLSSLKSTITSA